ncbi:hypothetical protein BBK36DRAFT_1134218 [Trichoderma citrinoviride]|uniref:DNA repair protein rhp7 treble clef domain-containing protein n=1 Tax=Trichoderma citrinoviride TaxID=58853 RepID=A0A2T4BJM9_9HYPO|nr:hypothetical protein BBK36DRAFT_1134218 [Trichoderma citrinoviride]PTB69469.1 hypothetical protein BBK36DRAFT_1134218 [Trichoderma citrinoviride]
MGGRVVTLLGRQGETTEENNAAEVVETVETVSVTVEASSSSRTTRSRNTAALDKIKASKAFKKRKKMADDDDDDDDIALAIFEERRAPLPGQMENCEICGKRFTVTPYSVAGPDGGLLCAPCGRQVAKEREGQPTTKKPRKQTGGVGSRRTIQSRMLDGDVGTKSLATLCVQTLAKNVDLAESLGDLPEHLIDKIARIFSKRRLLKPDTLPLFMQPSTEVLHIYDGAKLGHQEFINILQVASNLKKFKVRCAVQFKDEVMDYLLSRDIRLESFYLHGANLLSEEKWHEFLAAKGKSLKELQLLKECCPQLTRLKVCHNQKVTDAGVTAIGQLSSLRHLKALKSCITQIGKDLRTLSFKRVPDADDSLRITESEVMTDNGFAQLFTNWENLPLEFVDFQKCRQLDAAHPRENPKNIGLCSEGFKALMNHSGRMLRHVNAFGETKHFCEEVTDFILGCIFRACPNIKEVNVFGCMKVKEVRVPRGVILIGGTH